MHAPAEAPPRPAPPPSAPDAAVGPGAAGAGAVSTRRAVLGWRLVPAFERSPALVRLAKRPSGLLGFLALFALGLYAHGRADWLALTTCVGLAAFFPRARRSVLTAASLGWLVVAAPFAWGTVRAVARAEGFALGSVPWALVQPAAAAGALLGWALLVTRARRAAWRRPVAAFVGLYALGVAVAAHAPLPGSLRVALWALLVCAGSMLWFAGLAASDRRCEQLAGVGGTLRSSLGLLPFWAASAGTGTPFPKGSATLRKLEVATEEEAATCRLRALKLLIWAGWLDLFREALLFGVHGLPGTWTRLLGWAGGGVVPTYVEVFARFESGAPVALPLAWIAVATRFAATLLGLAVWGHVLVAVIRAAGFAALRNTWRPLESRSIADFWNRYYYYFKELLADVFFYPTFLRFFRGWPRLRLFAATFAAAGVGNFLFHLLRDVHLVARGGIGGALFAYRSYAVYATLLGVAIGLSQLRDRTRAGVRGRASGPAPARACRRALGITWVLGFYALVSVFDSSDPARGPGVCVAFLLSLFGAG